MMGKKLFILRHGEAESGKERVDRSRKLTPHGMDQVVALGLQMRSSGYIPDLILCSTSMRTRITAQLIIDATRYEGPVKYEENIYEASTQNLLDILIPVERQYNLVLLVGHNPSVSALADYLTNSRYLSMGPGQLVCIDLEMDGWDKLCKGIGTINWSYG